MDAIVFRFAADLLSLLRAISAIPVLLFSALGEWKAALAILILGWGTDLVDGWFARRYGSYLSGYDPDGIADTVLAFLSSAVPVAYAAWHTGSTSQITLVLLTIYTATISSAIWMVLIMSKPISHLKRAVVAINMIVMHGVIQIGAVIAWFAYMAYGAGTMMGLVISLLIFVVAAQERKLRMWWSGTTS